MRGWRAGGDGQEGAASLPLMEPLRVRRQRPPAKPPIAAAAPRPHDSRAAGPHRHRAASPPAAAAALPTRFGTIPTPPRRLLAGAAHTPTPPPPNGRSPPEGSGHHRGKNGGPPTQHALGVASTAFGRRVAGRWSATQRSRRCRKATPAPCRREPAGRRPTKAPPPHMDKGPPGRRRAATATSGGERADRDGRHRVNGQGGSTPGGRGRCAATAASRPNWNGVQSYGRRQPAVACTSASAAGEAQCTSLLDPPRASFSPNSLHHEVLPIIARRRGEDRDNVFSTESAFAKTPWTCKTIKLFSHDERYMGKSCTASRPAPRGSARTSGRSEKRRRGRRPWRRWWRSPT